MMFDYVLTGFQLVLVRVASRSNYPVMHLMMLTQRHDTDITQAANLFDVLRTRRCHPHLIDGSLAAYGDIPSEFILDHSGMR